MCHVEPDRPSIHASVTVLFFLHSLQASFNPNAVAALLQQSPFHLDSLMSMYGLYRNLGENSYAEVREA